MMAIIKLRQMKDSQSGTITAVTATGELGRRIRDMGITPGSAIKVQGRAPLYDPVAISLRNSEADYIEVDVNEEFGCDCTGGFRMRGRNRNRGAL
jgi:ferrous iron transport protein A